MTNGTAGRPPQTDRHLKDVGTNALTYSIGSLATKAVTFLLVPIFTNFLPQRDVGIIILLEIVELLYFYIAPFGILNGILRHYYTVEKEGDNRRFVASNYLFLISANLLIPAMLVSVSTAASTLLLDTPSYTSLLRFFFVSLGLGIVRAFAQTMLRILNKARLYIFFVFTDFLVLTSLTIWFVTGMELGLFGVIIAKVITSALLFVIVTTSVLRKCGFHFHPDDVRRAVGYGFPLILHGIGLLILTMADRYFIKELASIEDVATYGIAYKFGMIMNMIFVTPFIQAWQPLLFKLEDHAEQKLTYQKIGLYYVQTAAYVWLAISVAAKYLLRISTTPEYYAGGEILPWISFSYLLFGAQNIFKAGALLKNKTISLTVITIVSVFINIVLNVLAIPRWGILGAAMATVVSYVAMMFFTIFISQRCLAVSWRWRKMVSTIVLCIAAYTMTIGLTDKPLLNVAIDLATLVLLPMLMIYTKLISVDEIKRLLSLIRKK